MDKDLDWLENEIKGTGDWGCQMQEWMEEDPGAAAMLSHEMQAISGCRNSCWCKYIPGPYCPEGKICM